VCANFPRAGRLPARVSRSVCALCSARLQVAQVRRAVRLRHRKPVSHFSTAMPKHARLVLIAQVFRQELRVRGNACDCRHSGRQSSAEWLGLRRIHTEKPLTVEGAFCCSDSRLRTWADSPTNHASHLANRCLQPLGHHSSGPSRGRTACGSSHAAEAAATPRGVQARWTSTATARALASEPDAGSARH
jgi:hypothetical protein